MDKYLKYDETESVPIENVLKKEEVCTLITRKRSEYYKFTYDPTIYFYRLRNIGISESVINQFNGEIYHNCCNVVSIMLYLTPITSIQYYYMYIGCIRQTVINVRNSLPNWLVRVYMDTSVYKYVSNHDEETKIFKDIIDSPNVEIYTYDCESYKPTCIKDCVPISRTRMLRFMVMADPEVNMYAIREADGIVGNLDCHNLKAFEENINKIFYISPLHNLSKLYDDDLHDNDTKTFRTNMFKSYSPWLYLFKRFFYYDFFKENLNLYDLLAGVFSSKLKFRYDYFTDFANKLRDKCDEFNKGNQKDIIQELLKGTYKQLSNILVFVHKHRAAELMWDNEEKLINDIRGHINIGYDEGLLLGLFKDIISVKLKNILNDNSKTAFLDEKDVEKTESIMISANIKTITYDQNTQKEYGMDGICIKLLKDGIISNNINGKIIDEEFFRNIQKQIEKNDEYKKISSAYSLASLPIELYCKIDSCLINIKDKEAFDIIIIRKRSNIAENEYLLDMCNYGNTPIVLYEIINYFTNAFLEQVDKLNNTQINIHEIVGGNKNIYNKNKKNYLYLSTK